MPTSDYRNTVHVLDFVSRLDVTSVLDVGAGFGRWGFLLRCHLGGGHSLTVEPEQVLRIDAVEGFHSNVNPVYEAVYDNTFEGDAREVVPSLGAYDVIICGDMIEHLPKDDAKRLIDEMKRHARLALVMALPLGKCPQDAVCGNELEVHRSTWRRSDFAGSGAWVRVFRSPHIEGTGIAVAIWPFCGDARWVVKTLRNPLRRFLTNTFPGLLKMLGRG